MRSALLCVFFTLIVERSRAADVFRPLPIPVDQWREWRPADGGAGPPREVVTAAAPAVAALPAHYWEDALRHSVYLTLVRDKIDELIAKGTVINPNTENEKFEPASSEVEDHHLWEKIKSAPFDRLGKDEPLSQDDGSNIVAKGRLVEAKGGYRFTEDELSREKCDDEKCKTGIIALWSVKRVKHRTSPGKHHYELTFSVWSQIPKDKKNPSVNHVRTFTVRESSPEKVFEMPQEHPNVQKYRPQRVIWHHRNLVNTAPIYTQSRQQKNGLERLFSSLFTDDDDEYVPRHRPLHPPYGPPHGPPLGPAPPYSPYSKAGYVGSPSDQQKRLAPYPHQPQSVKYTRPLSPPPYAYAPKPYYLEHDSISTYNGPYVTPSDHGYAPPPPHPVLTTKPALLPTPLPSNTWNDDAEKGASNTTETASRIPDVITGFHKTYNKPRPGSMKINYLSDHVRPPVYNAPPGVFVTIDKKPFKPMPPLKYSSKPMKMNRPQDFRPSPQVLDTQQFSEPDPFFDSAFRPITWRYENTTTTEKIETAETSNAANSTTKIPIKSTTKGKKPPKKHENIKSQLTTATPDIITAQSISTEEEGDDDSDETAWAKLLSAFSKTTPMDPQKEKTEVSETSTSESTSTTETTTAARKRTTSTTETIEETTQSTPSTTRKPRRRTRPPPKFVKPDRIKKHKRVTTTTSTQAPDKEKTTQDLTPQASSVGASKPRSTTERPQTTTTTTTTTTTHKPTSPPTTTSTTTTTTTTPTTETTSTDSVTKSSTTQPKIKNRYRQSTLLTKGTSVNHDKWSATTSALIKTTTASPSAHAPRRKGSNFHGYVKSLNKNNDRENNLRHDDKDLRVKPLAISLSASYDENAEHYDGAPTSGSSNTVKYEHDDDKDDDDNYVDEETDAPSREQDDKEPTNDKTNEIVDSEITEQVNTSLTAQKNMTKCQKKKLFNSSTTEEPSKYEITKSNMDQNSFSSSTVTTTTESTTSSIIDEILGSFTVDDRELDKIELERKSERDQQESERYSHFVKLDDDLQDFLDSIEKQHGNYSPEDEYEDDEDLDDDDTSPLDKREDTANSMDDWRNSTEDSEPSVSLLDLMSWD